MTEDQHNEEVDHCADAVCELVDDKLLPEYGLDQIAGALLINTARVVASYINEESTALPDDAIGQEVFLDLQAVVHRHITKAGLKVENPPDGPEVILSKPDGSVDQHALRREMDKAIEEVQAALINLCEKYGSQIVCGSLFTHLGHFAADVCIGDRERRKLPKLMQSEADAIGHAVAKLMHKTFCESLQSHGAAIKAVDVTKVPPVSPETN